MKRTISIVLCIVLALLMTACGTESDITANVESVASIVGTGALGINNRFSGKVIASVEENIYKDENSTIAECFVEPGQHVIAGDLLFSYDTEAMELNLEKARLEIARIENTISGYESQLENLQNEKKYASSSQQLQYTLEIQATETSIREETYNLGVKQKALEQLEASVGETEVYAPISARVQTVNEAGGYDENGRVKPYITLLDTTSFRVEGTINETNMRSIYEGMPVLIRSRVDESTWTGVVSSIDYDNPVQNDNSNYYYGDTSNQSSKYHFYVELDNSEELMLGQHVYIEFDNGSEETVLMLPEYYLNEINGTTAWVWAASTKGTLEKRTVTLGAYSEDAGCYEIVSGLELSDSIAFPDEAWKVGMKVVDASAIQ